MKKNYFFSAAVLFGAAALMCPVANAEGWRNMNHLLPNVSKATGWSGVLTGGAGDRGVGEIFAGAGMVYQVVRDLPAGEYTLQANAFYRDGAAPECAVRHFDGGETKDAVIFANDVEVPVKSLFDVEGLTRDAVLSGTEYNWSLPNDLGAAADSFNAGNYLNTLKVNHPGGDMIIGFKCYGKPGTLDKNVQLTEEVCNAWSAFTNFKLTNAAGEDIALGGDGKFDMVNDANWHVENVSGGNKGRGIQNGGVFSKTNASVYDHSVTVADLPAGKYRFSIQSFNQHFLGAHSGYFIPMKKDFYVHEGKSAYDLYKEGATEYMRGQVEAETLKDATVSVDKLGAFLYAYNSAKIPMKDYWDGENEVNDWFLGYDEDGKHIDGAKDLCSVAIEKPILNLFEPDYEEYLEVQNYKMPNGEWKYINQWDGTPTWFESGHMREVAAAFVADPNLYKNTIEFELEAPSTVTIGYHKDVNQNNYANPVFDFKLEYFDPNYTGYDVTGGAAVEGVEAAATAAPEYYTLQGVRVANPQGGIFIVREGNKVSKKVIR